MPLAFALLIVGAALAYFSALGCAFFGVPSNRAYTFIIHAEVLLTPEDIEWLRDHSPESPRFWIPNVLRGTGYLDRWYTEYDPRHDSYSQPSTDRSLGHVHAGWPLHTLGCTYDGDRTRGGLVMALPAMFGAKATVPRIVPLIPEWPGFAVTTLAGAAIAGIAWISLRQAFRWLRLRRGRCPGCGYRLSTSHCCPECGFLVTRNQAPNEALQLTRAP